MRTDELIAVLAAEPAPRAWPRHHLAAGAAMGLTGAALVWLAAYGPRTDLALAAATSSFWVKLLYALASMATAAWLVFRAGRPGKAMATPALLMLAPLALLAPAAGLTLSDPEADMAGLILGHSAASCSIAILFIALPALASAFWTLRQLAPTRLTEAGASAGLFAGSEGAFVYAFSCTEDAIPFVALWYTLGILLTATLGAFLGRSLLRW
jgi:hypothetical protein